MTSALRAVTPIVLFVISLLLNVYTLGGAVLFAVAGFCVAFALPVRPTPPRRLSLETVALLALAGYSLAVPIHQVAVRDYDPVMVRMAFELCTFAVLGMFLGFLLEYLLASRSVRSAQMSRTNWSSYALIGWIVFGFGMLSAAAAVAMTIGFHAYLTAGYAGRVLLKRAAGPVELGLYYAVVGLLIVVLARAKSHAERPKLTPRRVAIFVLLWGICLVFVAYVSFLGIRRPSFFLLLSLVMLRGAAGRGFSKLQVGLLAPLLLIFSLFANFRQVLSDQGLSATTAFVRQNFSLAWFDLSRSELGAPFRAIMDVLATWQHDPLRLGSTFLAAVPYLLPSSLGVAVTSLSQEYTVRNFSSAFIAIGGNMGFSPVAEAYLNYGEVGVFLYFIVVGFCVAKLQANAFARGYPFDLLGYAIAAPWFIFWLRTDLASFSKSFVYSIVVPLIFAVCVGALIRSWRSESRLRSYGQIHPVTDSATNT